MQTLQQLISGELQGTKTLKLSCGLTSFPNEIFTLSDTLELLDLSNNKLSQLPKKFKDLKKLKIVFLSSNLFTEFPTVFSECDNLTMIGFKSNQIKYIPEFVFPKNIQWLILTDNRIEEIPKSIGTCLKLQKFGLAGNNLKNLPKEMESCRNLQLLRISANQISQLPNWLFSLPKLSWLAFSGNPCSNNNVIKDILPIIDWNELEIEKQLGEGASGIISEATWRTLNKTKVAVKVFKGEVTSDGFPEDEMKSYSAIGYHKNLVNVIGKINNHPNKKSGLVLELIPSTFKNLGYPPSFETCTRDTFSAETIFSIKTILFISQSIADACKYLHYNGIMHGDLYAHNILIDDFSNTIFGDFGAATFYNKNNLELLEYIDVRAFGCLLEDLLNHSTIDIYNRKTANALLNLKEKCLNEVITDRPKFIDILNDLKLINNF